MRPSCQEWEEEEAVGKEEEGVGALDWSPGDATLLVDVLSEKKRTRCQDYSDIGEKSPDGICLGIHPGLRVMSRVLCVTCWHLITHHDKGLLN